MISPKPQFLAVTSIVLQGVFSTAVAFGDIGVRQIKAEGRADIVNGAVDDAREAALRDAQKKAIEQVVGIHVQSLMKDEMKSLMKDAKESFTQNIEAKVYTKSEGFIETYKVLKEKKDGKTYRVKIRAQVRDTALSRELALMVRELMGGRYPKVIALVQESYTGQDGKTQKVNPTTFGAILGEAFMARGFDLVAARPDNMQGILTNPQAAAAFGRSAGADYVVLGEAAVKFTSYNDHKQGDYHAQTMLSVQVVHTNSGEVVATENATKPSRPAFQEAQLRAAAIEWAAPKVIETVTRQLLHSWSKALQTGATFLVVVQNVASYRREGRQLLGALETIPKAKNVRKVAYRNAILTIELSYPGAEGIGKLEEAVFTAVQGDETLAKLDLVASEGQRLTLKL